MVVGAETVPTITHPDVIVNEISRSETPGQGAKMRLTSWSQGLPVQAPLQPVALESKLSSGGQRDPAAVQAGGLPGSLPAARNGPGEAHYMPLLCLHPTLIRPCAGLASLWPNA